jgi:hypothetical protein
MVTAGLVAHLRLPHARLGQLLACRLSLQLLGATVMLNTGSLLSRQCTGLTLCGAAGLVASACVAAVDGYGGRRWWSDVKCLPRATVALSPAVWISTPVGACHWCWAGYFYSCECTWGECQHTLMLHDRIAMVSGNQMAE